MLPRIQQGVKRDHNEVLARVPSEVAPVRERPVVFRVQRRLYSVGNLQVGMHMRTVKG